ncbi:MAG: YncE family protein, partial [Planctomycetota bacterium]
MHIRSAPSAVALLLAVPVFAQGRTDYMNVETPQVKPITVARIAGHDYVLACNTPDNSVSIFTTDESVPAGSRLLRRVPVGLEPCSVVWNPLTKCFYTADFLSDSITRVYVEAPTGPASLNARVISTKNIKADSTTTLTATDTTSIDEPMDVALVAGGAYLVVSSGTDSSITFLNANSLEPELPPGAHTSIATTTVLSVPMAGNALHAAKEPRRLLVSGNEVLAVAFKGGRTLPGSFNQGQINSHDLDIVGVDYVTGTRRSFANLGTTNAGAALTSAGDLMLVGGFAHIDEVGGSAVKNLETGFVDHRLWCLRPGPGGQVGAGAVLVRDLNDDPTQPGLNKVVADLALAGLRDVVTYESAGSPTKLFLAAMHSDRIAVLTDNGGPIDTWPLARIDLTPNAAPVSDMRGPRGLAFKAADVTTAARVYVLNRVSHSMLVIDADTHAVLAEMGLGTNPEPTFLRDGRPFLYSARLSQNGFNSCASCHMDGRTDSLSWELGAPIGSMTTS